MSSFVRSMEGGQLVAILPDLKSGPVTGKDKDGVRIEVVLQLSPNSR